MDLLASVGGITVQEKLELGAGTSWDRCYYVSLKFHPAERIKEAFGLDPNYISNVVTTTFIPKLSHIMKAEMKRSATGGDTSSIQVNCGSSSDLMESDSPTSKSRKKKSKDDEYDDEVADDEDGVAGSRFGHKKEMTSYGDMDDDDKKIAKQSAADESEEDEPATITEAEESDDEDDGNMKTSWSDNLLKLDPLRVDPASCPLLMVGLVERAAEGTVIRARPNIAEGFVNKEEGRGRCLQTAGCNFEEIWQLSDEEVDHTKLVSNHIWGIRCAYGVEAARMSIADQIRGVFAVYGISVDPRHLSLIADFMTYDGEYKPMNRIGMADVSSTFLQMSFESTSVFMVDAALHKRNDPMMSPSANIVMGHPIRHGTGAFECIAARNTTL
jgi:DNA-directed RNA polymerase I subunit RPA1